MHTTTKQLTPTKVELTVEADQELMTRIKDVVLAELAKDVQLTGFRKGHAPAAMVEKAVDPNQLQSRFLDEAVSELYATTVVEQKLRPVSQPQVEISKYVPFTQLEAKIVVEVIGAIKLADYKKFKMQPKVVKVEDKEVEAVIDDLLKREAPKVEVKRAAIDGDEVVIDFVGTDAKTGDAIPGADGNDYPLTIGSNTFIPGFEPELIGLKSEDKKTFTITFPADYGSKELQNRKVQFAITVKKVSEVQAPKLDDAFAATVGPFKTVAELRIDIRKQLQVEKENQAQRELENDLLTELAKKSKAEIPTALVEEEIDRMEAEEKRNIVYRGQTWQEHLTTEGKTEEEHREGQREQAELRVRTGVVLGEVAQVEGVTVEEDELDTRIAELKGQYPDAQMQGELEKPENRRDIASRILTEKTITKLVAYASK